MTLSQQFTAIAKLLREHQYLHEQELLKRQPAPLPDPYQDWQKEISSWNDNDIAQFEYKLSADKIQSTDFSDFTNTIKSLSWVKQVAITPNKLSANVKRGMTPKKVHEIEFISHLFDQKINTPNIIDIGSGKGLLSAALTHQHPRQSICIDMDQQLQIQGKKRLQKWLPDTLSKIQFIHQKIDKNKGIPAPSGETTLIGLHACGNLSSQIIQQAVNQKMTHIINFGCCYHHIRDDYNLSIHGKQQNLWFSHEALHLAAHAHRLIDANTIQKRTAVKRYRYALHLFLTEHYHLPFQKVGDGKTADYQRSFATYAKKFAPQLQGVSDGTLDRYFNQKSTQTTIQDVLSADSIRNVLGRLIELYIVLDRCLYLEEKGYEVTLHSCFDRRISPRNLGIIANKKAPEK